MAEVRTLRTGPSRGWFIFTTVVLGLVAVVAAFPALLVALVAHLLGRPLFNRWHWATLAVASLVGYVLSFTTMTSAYFLWYAGLFGFDQSLANLFGVQSNVSKIPVFAVVSLGVFLASAVGVVFGSDPLALKHSISSSSGKFTLNNKVKVGSDTVPHNHAAIRAKIIKMPSMLDLIPQGWVPQRVGKKSVPPGKRRFPLGRGRDRRPVWLTEEQLSTHGVLLGSTGCGKTESIKWLAGAMLDMGYDGFIVDLKEDLEPGGLRDYCRATALHRGIPYQEVALSDSDGRWWFNALEGMNADQAFNSIMTASEFDDQYHQNMNRKVSGQVLQLMYHAHSLAPDQFTYPNLFDLGRYLEKDVFSAVKPMVAVVAEKETAAGNNGKAILSDLYPALLTRDQDLLKEARSFGLRLTNLYDSQSARHVLLPGKTSTGEDRVQVNLTSPGLTYLGLNSNALPEMASTVGSTALQRVNVLAANISTGKIPKGKNRFIIIDEANFINRKLLMNMLSRVRSAGLRIIVATQGPEDWIDEKGDDWGALIQNINVAMIMKQNSPTSSELSASYLGEESQASMSIGVHEGEIQDSGSISQKVDYLVQPSTLRGFDKGEMVLRTPGSVQWLQVPLRDEELDEYIAKGSPVPTPAGFIPR